MFVSEYFGLNDELDEMGGFDCVLDNDSRFFINSLNEAKYFSKQANDCIIKADGYIATTLFQ